MSQLRFSPARVLFLFSALAATVVWVACSSKKDPVPVAPLPLDGGGDSDVSVLGDAGPRRSLPAVPFHTDSRWILDSNGKRFKLASVTWYGAEEKDYVVAGLDRANLIDVSVQIRAMGFNSVRLPWSNELLKNPKVDPARLAKNPALVGLTAMEIFDRVIDALAWQGLVVILDNHTSDANWCCSDTDGNGLWYSDNYSDAKWVDDWHEMALRYKDKLAVVGAELRNSIRPSGGKTPTWGGSTVALDWRDAATRGAKAVQQVRADWLVVVGGIGGGGDLRGVFSSPLTGVSGVVYAPHDYSWFHTGATDFASVQKSVGDSWGYILTQGQKYTAPIWVSEFGTAQADAKSGATTAEGIWFQSFTKYLTDADIDWSYWALNGTAARGADRTVDTVETFGVLDPNWAAPASSDLLTALQKLQPATQFP